MIAIGTIVEVYEDPWTMLHKEGNAKIVEQITKSDIGIDLYDVCFIGEDQRMVVQRWIAEKPLCTCCDPTHAGDDVNCPVHGIKSAQMTGGE